MATSTKTKPKAKAKKAPAKKATPKGRNATGQEVRIWLNDNGFNAGERGRFSGEMIEAYNKKHPRRKYVVGRERQERLARAASNA